ncbi:hypothetical protein ACFWAR_36410 [Streptomyces sp. NPDC059917]|uniref:hypothetical protein n=1 Tax=Streptomyces sp. NPDC059917 TaxID=3347002 RepID=UPI00365FE557
MDRTRNLVNRLILLTGGAVLLAAGTAVLTHHAPGASELPRWWAAFGDRGHWIAARTGWGSRSGWDPAAAGAVLLLASSSAAVLLLQLRRRIVRRLPLSAPGTTLETGALTTAVTARLRPLPGVVAVRGSLRGTPAHPCLGTRLVLDDTASPRQVLTALTTDVMPEARRFLTPHPLTAEARITVRARPRRRAV